MGEFKFGRRPPVDKPALRLSSILTGVLPPHPSSEDYLAGLTDWQVLGNDYFGDCVAVTWANMRRLVTANLTDKEVYPSLDQVYAIYRTQNPNFVPNPSNPVQDNGMVIQLLLEYLVKTGGPDGVKAVAFAKVDLTNDEEVRAALSIFGSLWAGITVLQANERQFDQNQPWDYDRTSPVAGGHSVEAGGYLGKVTEDVRFITWGRETGFTMPYWDHLVEEAWVVIWPEHLGTRQFQMGVDLPALADAYKQLTGQNLPVPLPPAPPSGCLDTADKALALAITAWAYSRHRGSNRLAALAAQAWLKAKGLS